MHTRHRGGDIMSTVEPAVQRVAKTVQPVAEQTSNLVRKTIQPLRFKL